MVARPSDSVLALIGAWGFILILYFAPNAQSEQIRAAAVTLWAVLYLTILSDRLPRHLIIVILLCTGSSGVMLGSVVANLQLESDFGHALLSSAKPLYFGVIYCFGYVLIRESTLTQPAIRDFLAHFAAVFLIAQTILALLQALGYAESLDILYRQEKVRSRENLLRVTGSMGNPNGLALTVLHCSIIWLFWGPRAWLVRGAFLISGCSLVALTGSRSVAVLLVAVLIVVWLTGRRSVAERVGQAILAIAATGVVLYLVWPYIERFRYLLQLALLFGADPIREVGSLATRVEHWASALSLFASEERSYKFLLGLGAIEHFRVLDNDYLYVFLRYGVLGVLWFYGFFVFVAQHCFHQNRDTRTRNVLALMLASLVLLGFVSETFSGWYQPALVLFTMGVLSAKRTISATVSYDGAAATRK